MKRFARLLALAFPGVGLAAAQTATVKRKVQPKASPTPVPASAQTVDRPVARAHEPRGIMCCLGISQSRSAGIHVVLSAAICLQLGVPTGAAKRQTYSSSSNIEVRPLPKVKALQATTWPGHPPDTKTGQKVSSGMSAGQKVAIIGGIAAAAITTTVVVHNYQHKQPSVDNLMEKGPHVLENVSMSHMIVDGLIGPGWPVAVDFQLDGPGSLILDITTGKVRYHQELTNDLQGRGITISHPPGLPDKLQPAIFDLEAVAPDGSDGPPPTVRIYGIAVGPQAVGSIAIDQLEFGPSIVKMKQTAQYGFHSHSDFSNVCADFMFTGMKDNRIVMKQDSETTTLHAVSRDEHAQGSFETKGTVGPHLLQIRAWRGDSGDWVVAWSPDVVTLTK